ncbi:MAG TPA: hypothetical protein VG819_03570 [Rhizomicrobium sp.]|jgi:tetratricopeptide (TPR) repeat protein|nr:hypothetical protein [Rhizomicrobium sp.]
MRRFLFAAAAAAALLSSSAPALAIASGSWPAMAQARREFDIGVDLVNHGAYAQATPHLEAALNEFPDDTDILNYLGFVHRLAARQMTGTAREGELRLASTYYRRALDSAPSRKAFLEFMGEIYLDMNNVPAAREKLKALDSECPEGCAERDMLARSISTYVPPPPPVHDLPPAPAR